MPDETVDLPTRVDALEQRVNPVEAMTEVATAIRADMATIAEGVDPTLAQPWPSRVHSRESRPAVGPATRQRVAARHGAPAAPRPTEQ
jgi:hypothetical protein